MTDGPIIGRTLADSRPAFEPLPRPPSGAPNVVLVVLDDLGFGQLGCFGSDLGTPTIDRLAAQGARYNRFHVTALCSPTRACLLTGRNHHAVGMGFLTDVPTGFPGYNGRIPPSAAALPRILRDAGYSTLAVGKWHLAPRWEQSASGPFARWPLGLGFERFYGFLGGDTNQWTPELVRDNGFVEPPRAPEDGYHLTEDLVDQAMRLVQDQQQATPTKPFFLYFATGATHAPHHAPRAAIDRYRGQFDDGWDAWRAATFDRQIAEGVVPAGTTLPPRPPWVDAWDDLSADQRRLFARLMEAFAGFLSHTDEQLGRLVAHLETLGVLEDTLVLLCSDNGTSAEGGPYGSLNEHRFTHQLVDDPAETLAHLEELGGFRAYNHYPWGWAWAGNTPLRLWKRYTWLGGVRTPLVARWPGRVTEPGGLRTQFCHAVDLFATVLDAAGVEVPDRVDGVTQQPVDGASLVPTFADPGSPSPRDTQYFEMIGSRAIYHDGWKATTDHVGNQLDIERDRIEGSRDYDTDHWALFHLDEDFSEAHDRSHEHPDLTRRLAERWWSEAGRNQVLPLDDSLLQRFGALEPAPFGPRARAVLRPGGGPVSEDAIPSLIGGFVLEADLDVPPSGAEGVICALGDWNNGWACYLLGGVPVVAFSVFGYPARVAADRALAPGSRIVRVEYQRKSGPGGTLHIAVDGAVVADGTLTADLPFRWQIGGAGLLVGRDRGFPVCDDYATPFPCTATIRAVVLESGSAARHDQGREITAALRHE
ncbi:MAG TPA: arylsulfatase [Acidimicrobiia bacterium]|nr:arylsulfatase [Acidimicrobiia bacterium]